MLRVMEPDCQCGAHLHEDLVMPFAVGIKAMHEVLPRGPYKVLGQGQVPDGGIGCLI